LKERNEKVELNTDSLVIQNILLKRKLLQLRSSKAKEFRTVLLILSGANCGAYGAGSGMALHELGLENVFDLVVGVSTGAWIGAYFLAGAMQMRLGASIYYENFSGSRFVSYRRGKFIFNKEAIVSATRNGRKTLNIEAVQSNRSEFFVGVTTQDGSGIFIDAKTAIPDMWAALDASSASPLAYHRPVTVDHSYYWDGGIAFPFPIRQVCDQFLPTDILVLPNVPQSSKRNFHLLEYLFGETMLRHIPRHLRGLIYRRKKLFRESLSYLSKIKDVNIGILYPPDCELHSLSRNPQKLRMATQKSADRTLEVFGEYGRTIDL
jgi:predicted patatin/cPLA2 family phospholipase